MNNKFTWFLTVIILLLSVKLSMAQPNYVNGFAVQHFTDENGLPQNSINDLLFDKEGYLWLATQVGLVRFDGHSFKSYYPGDKPIMESNIVSLGRNENGTLFFQTLDHYLYCYRGTSNVSLSPVSTPAARQPFLLNTQKRLFDFSDFLQHAPSAAESRKRNSIFANLCDHNENFYVAEAGHIYFADHDSLYYYNGRSIAVISPIRPSYRFLLTGERFYVMSRDSVIGVFNEGSKTLGSFKIKGDLGIAQSLPHSADEYRLFSCDGADHLMVGHRLYRLFSHEDGLTATFVVDLDFIPNISAVEYNKNLDLLLIATNTEGFYFLRKDRFVVDGWPAGLRNRMAAYLFGPMAMLDNKEILTDRFVFNPAGAFEPTTASTAIWQRVLYIDRRQQVWAAHDSFPIQLTRNMEPAGQFPAIDANIVDYGEDSVGNLYCLTEKSLWKREKAAFRQLHFPDHPAGSQLNEVLAIIAPRRLWIGGTNGLFEYDPDANTVRSIPEFQGKHVRAIHRCQDGTILIGTYGQGYYYYFHQRFIRMPLDKHGFLVTAHCFLEDPEGNVWIPCNKGLFKVPKADMDAWARGESDQLYYYYYGRQDGLLTNEFNGGFNASGIITPRGFVALLSMKGMVCFYTDSLQTNFPQGSIDMSDLEIDGRPAPKSDTIKLSPGYNSLVAGVASPYLGNRNNLYLQYNLRGLNDEWKEVPEDGMLNFSRLAPGNYTLGVRKVNGFGKNNYQYRQWSIIIPPNFYQTTAFATIAGLVLVLLLGVLVQLRLKLVEKKKEIRVKAEKLKGAVVRLEETVDKLQHSEQALLRTSKQREKLISLVIHDLRSPLRFLTLLAGDLHDNQANFSAADLKERSYRVKKGAQDIYHFSEDFLLWVTSQKDNFKIAKQLFFVRPLLQELYDFYLEQVMQKGNTISYDAPDDLQLYSDPHLLITIIRNLTDNANKYTEQGAISISARQEGCWLIIGVADTGKGMNPQQVAAFLGEDSLDNVRSGSQLGHKFIFDLTQRLDGVLSVKSVENTGTDVCLRIPIEHSPPPVRS
jgi:signal transduction histidine kinase/ligand-binding sensor domain-containing protein